MATSRLRKAAAPTQLNSTQLSATGLTEVGQQQQQLTGDVTATAAATGSGGTRCPLIRHCHTGEAATAAPWREGLGAAISMALPRRTQPGGRTCLSAV